MTVGHYQESRKTRLLLFVSSLAPALIIAGIRLVDAHRLLSVLLVALGIIALLLTPLVLFLRRHAGRRELTVSNIKDESSQIPTYLITFVFPFLFLSEDMSRSLIASYIGFVGFMALLLYRTPLSLINPAMLVQGYRVYSVDILERGGAYIISKTPPLPSQPTYAKRVAEGLYISIDEPVT